MKDKIKGDKYVFNNSQIGAVGKNAQSNNINNFQKDESALNKTKEEKDLQSMLKELISQNRIDECIQNLMKYFKETSNAGGLNNIIMQSASYHEILQKENFSLLSAEELKIRKNILNKALIEIIDTKIQ